MNLTEGTPPFTVQVQDQYGAVLEQSFTAAAGELRLEKSKVRMLQISIFLIPSPLQVPWIRVRLIVLIYLVQTESMRQYEFRDGWLRFFSMKIFCLPECYDFVRLVSELCCSTAFTRRLFHFLAFKILSPGARTIGL